MAELEFHVLGSTRVLRGGEILAFKTKKSFGLLAYLLLEPGWHSRDALAALFWPDATEEDGRASLRNALAFLRKTLEPTECLVIERERLQFASASSFTLDLHALEAGFRHAPQATPATLEPLESAAHAFRGDLLEGLALPDAPEFEDWLGVRREAARRQITVVLERLSTLQLESGQAEQALETAQRWLHLEPHADTACRHALRCAITLEQPILALEVFESFRTRLEHEMGSAPEAETVALAERLRLEANSPRSAKPRSKSLEAPMVGRHLEHARLVEAFHTATAQHTQVVMVSGEAGIGKTRLAQEFLGWARAQGATVLRGRSFETGGRLPYQPVIEVLRDWLERETNPLETLSATWLGELSALLPELRERHPDLPPATVDESIGRARLFESVARLVQALGAQAPTVVSVDDLQWMDAASRDLLQFVIHRAVETRSSVLAVFTVRSEELPVTPGLNDWLEHLGREASIEHLELPALGADATQHWLESIGASTDGLETFAGWLYLETQGQPLYISQTLKNLLERGVLKSSASSGLDYSSVANGEIKPELAPGVREVIRARINRLGPSAFALLSAGAVLGQDLEFGQMCQVAGLPESDGLTALDEVLTARLLLEGEAYVFAHDKIRDVAYTEAGDARRKVFHRRALETLEAEAAPAPSEWLALHAFMARLAHHAWAANQWAKAFKYSLEAAAEAQYNLDQVQLEHTMRARALLREPPKGFDPLKDTTSDQRIELYDVLAGALNGLREHERATEILQEMLEYARSIGDERLEVYALLWFARAVSDGQASQGFERECLEQALNIAERSGQRQDWVYAQNGLTHLEFYHWNHRAALERGTMTLPVARAVLAESDPHDYNNVDPLRDCIRTLAQTSIWSGRWDEALALYQEDEALLRPFPFHRLHNANNRFWQGAMLLNLGRVAESLELGRIGFETYFELMSDNPFNSVSSNWYSRELLEHGDLSTGLEVATRGFNLIERPKTDVFWRIGTYWNLAYALGLLGQLDRAFELLRVSLEENEIMLQRNAWGIANQDYLHSFLAGLHALRGEWPHACKHMVQATQARFQIDAENAWNTPRMRRDLETEALLHGGEIDLARKSVERLGEFAGHYVRRQIPYLRSLAVLETWDGNLESAIRHLEEARALMIPMGLPNERWTLEAKLAELYEQNGDLERSKEARATALQVIDSLAEKITDLEMRQGFLEFTQTQIGGMSS